MYYDFNRNSLTNRTVIGNLYGADKAVYSDERLSELNIYPIEQPEVPFGFKINPLQTAEEEAHGGPIFELMGSIAVQKVRFMPIDPTRNSYESLWMMIKPSKTMAQIGELAKTDLDANVRATMLLNAITSSRITGEEEAEIIQNELNYFFPLLTGDAVPELKYILDQCGLKKFIPAAA
jgi:hypothetical protein